MFQSTYVFVSTAIVLWLGLSFLRIRGIRAFFHSFLTGLVCGELYYWMCGTNLPNLCFGIEVVLICLAALAVRVWLRCNWETNLHIFLIAESAFCVLWIPIRFYDTIGIRALGIGAFVSAAFVLLVIVLRERFPEREWQQSFISIGSDDRMGAQQQMYLIPVGVSVLLTGICLILPVDTLLSCSLLTVLCAVVLWLSIWLMMVITAYQKEQSTLLAEQQYRGEMQSFLNVIRSQRHDYNFHVQTIAGLIRQNKMEDCLRYINALEEDVAIMNAVLPVRDPAIAALIHNFRLMAVRQGTDLHVDIHYDLSQIATNVYETNKIISNLLQNAIDEVSTHEDKSHGIWLTILKRGEYCVIRVSNKLKETLSQEDLDNIYRQGYTTKQGHEGVGLSSLRTLVGRYKGVIYTQVEGDEIQFVARVPINYAKEPMAE